jgi:hypothetical protein
MHSVEHRRFNLFRVSETLSREIGGRDERWSETIAVGNLNFIEKVQNKLVYKAAHREVH